MYIYFLHPLGEDKTRGEIIGAATTTTRRTTTNSKREKRQSQKLDYWYSRASRITSEALKMSEGSPTWASESPSASPRRTSSSQGPGTARKANGTPAKTGDEVADRTAVVAAQLKRIYRKAVLPVEKRYKYDYFYDSPLLTEVEFDGMLLCGTCVCWIV